MEPLCVNLLTGFCEGVFYSAVADDVEIQLIRAEGSGIGSKEVWFLIVHFL